MSFEDIDYARIGIENGYDPAIAKDIFSDWQFSVEGQTIDDPDTSFATFLQNHSRGESAASIIERSSTVQSTPAQARVTLSDIPKKRAVKFVKKTKVETPASIENQVPTFTETSFGGVEVKETETPHVTSFGGDRDVSSVESVYKRGVLASRSKISTDALFKENNAHKSIEEALRSYGVSQYSSYDDSDDEEDTFDLEKKRAEYGLSTQSNFSFTSSDINESKSEMATPTTTTPSPLESWDDIIESIEGIEDEIEPTPGERAQEQLKNMLVREAMHVTDDISVRNHVFVLVPSTNVAVETVDRIKKSKSEKINFVKAHVITMTGSQPEEQLFDRPYKAINKVSYDWPSTGARRLVGERSEVMLGGTGPKVVSKYGKIIKPIYMLDDMTLG